MKAFAAQLCIIVALFGGGSHSVYGNPCVGQSNGVFVDNPESCRSFFACVDGAPVAGECEPRFWFNPANQQCDWPENVNCLECPPNVIVLLPDPADCRNFVFCFNGQGTHRTCADRLRFDEREQSCRPETEVDCIQNMCPATSDPNVVITIPSAEDCRVYYICFNGEDLRRECAPGLHWNQNMQRCDHPELADCKVTEVGPPNPAPPVTSITCPSMQLEVLPNKSSCQHYFVCSNGISTMFQCAPGLIFDWVNLQCNFKEMSVCNA